MALEKKYKDKIIVLISAMIPDAKIILFGSRATSLHSDCSDIDIALDTGKKLNRFYVGEVRDVLNATRIPYKIDLVDYYGVSASMQEDIRNEGIIWKN